jgi:hypothetical protein
LFQGTGFGAILELSSIVDLSDQFPLTSWLIQYVEESSETNFIDLTEIKSKFHSDVLVEFPSSRTIGNLNTKLLLFPIIASPFPLLGDFFSVCIKQR